MGEIIIPPPNQNDSKFNSKRVFNPDSGKQNDGRGPSACKLYACGSRLRGELNQQYLSRGDKPYRVCELYTNLDLDKKEAIGLFKSALGAVSQGWLKESSNTKITISDTIQTQQQTSAKFIAPVDATKTQDSVANGTGSTDATGTDATDAEGTDAADSEGTDATDAAGTDSSDTTVTDIIKKLKQ